MKRINIENQRGNQDKPAPIGGLIWRYILFLILLFGFLILLRWLHSLPEDSSSKSDIEGIDLIDNPTYIDDLDEEELNDVNIEIPEYIDENGDIVDERFKDDEELMDIINEPLPEDNFQEPIKELPSPEENRRVEPQPEDIITPEDDPYKQIDGTLIDVILEDNSEENFKKFARKLKQMYPDDNVNIEYYNPEAGLMQIMVNPTDRERVKSRIQKEITDIEYKLFDDVMFNNSAVSGSKYNDPAFKSQKKSWHFAPIQTYEAWEITQGSEDIVVAVIDSYIDITHPEFKGRVVKPFSVERRSRNVMPPPGPYSFHNPNDAVIYHGTHVAGLAVGALNNGAGAAGLAPNCKLMPISLGAHMSSSAMLEGVLYAINQGADVINLSLQQMFPPEAQNLPLNTQLEYINQVDKYQEDVWDYVFKLADKKNCTIVWAAGNCNVLSGMDETKRGESTIRVSAVGPDLKKADFSNYGNYESQGINYSTISAPGVDIYSAGPANGYGFCPGTSMAAPIVSGAVALMKSVNPNLTNTEIIEILDKTGKVVDRNGHIGKLIQVRDALEAAGADVAKFDDIKEDPNKIKGLWKTTEERIVVNSETEEPTGEMTHVYLKFSSINGGTIYYKVGGGSTFSAPFKSELRNNKLTIRQQGDATSSTNDVPFRATTIECKRGANGMLECVSYTGNKKQDSKPFFLVRSNDRI
ncbi:MAG: S8 family serine peptidase [Muribaculaceae bacterium]|nr:S8 family serine peptidase [Muribaculaceae bacterium]